MSILSTEELEKNLKTRIKDLSQGFSHLDEMMSGDSKHLESPDQFPFMNMMVSKPGIELLQKKGGKVIRLYFDGSSNSQVGRAGAGWVIVIEEGKKKQKIQGSKKLGNKNSNEAEWIALLEGVKNLEMLDHKEFHRVFIYGDSQLVINQLTGLYRVRAENLQMYANETKKSLEPYWWIAKWIPHEFNDEADYLARLESN